MASPSFLGRDGEGAIETISDIHAAWHAHREPFASVAGRYKAFFEDYCHRDLFVNALARLQKQEIDARNIAALTARTKVETIEDDRGCQSSLVEVWSSSELIATSPFESIVHLISSETDLVLRRFRILNFDVANDLPVNLAAEFIDEVKIKPGDIFAIAGPPAAYEILGLSRAMALFHRIDRRIPTPFVYNFSRENNTLRAISFVSEIETSHDFFVELCSHVGLELRTSSLDDARLDFRRDERAIADFLSRYSLDPEANIATRWKAVQGLGPIEPERAIKSLEQIAAAGPKNAKARARLVLNEIRDQ